MSMDRMNKHEPEYVADGIVNAEKKPYEGK